MTISFPALEAANREIAAKQKALGDLFAEGIVDGKLDLSLVKSLDGTNEEKSAELQRRNDELTKLTKDRDGLKATLGAAERLFKDGPEPDDGDDDGTGESGDETYSNGRKAPTFTDMFLKSDAYLHPGEKSDFDVKTLLSTTAGFAPDSVRGPLVVPIAQRPIELVDLIPKFATAASSVVWMEQTTRTNAAAETAEAGAKPEATIVYTERTSVVRKIAVILPVTDEQMDDVPQLESIIRVDLTNMVRQRLSDEIAAGDGIAPNLLGVLNVVGIQTQAKGADPTPDAVYKAMVKVMTTGQANPDAFVTNPLDWQDVRLLRTVDGIYIWGNPSEAGPERIWGLRVVLAQGMTQNTGVVGDFGTYSRLAIRKDVTVDSGYVNDDFSKNRRTLRAEMRAALMFIRPAAFCSVTGI